MDFIVLDEWARMARKLKANDRIAFWDALVDFALDSKEPTTSIGIVAVTMARRLIEKHRARVEAGRNGGIKRQASAKQTASKLQANAKQTASKLQANAKQTASKLQANAKQTQAERIERIERIDPPNPPMGGGGVDLESVISDAELWGLPHGATRETFNAALADEFRKLVAAGWADANGRPVRNWRLYLKKAVFGKKFSPRESVQICVPEDCEE